MCCLFLYNTHCIHNKEMSRKQMIVLYQTVEGTNFASGKQHELNQCGCDVNIAGWVATPPCTPPIAMLTGIPCVNLRNKFLSNVPPKKQKGQTTLKSGGGGGAWQETSKRIIIEITCEICSFNSHAKSKHMVCFVLLVYVMIS
jgi:hypothetical protein